MKKYILLLLLGISCTHADNHPDKISGRIAYMIGAGCGNKIQYATLLYLLKKILTPTTSISFTDVNTTQDLAAFITLNNAITPYDIIKNTLTINYFWGFIKPVLANDDFLEKEYNTKNKWDVLKLFIKGFLEGVLRNPIPDPIIRFFGSTKSSPKRFVPTKTTDTFDSVIGAHEAKKELKTIIDFLIDPEHFSRLGARPHHGILLLGDSGNGKTHIARAVAGQAECAFFNVSGSEFVEVYVGTGAARIRELFEEARNNAPSVIFIDEIDCLAGKRNNKNNAAEIDQTLNQLLIEMDGFNKQNKNKPIIVIAATNHINLLDPAILRHGRLDRHITIPYPDNIDRQELLTLYSNKIVRAPFLDIKKLAHETGNFSCANLVNLVNQATLLATAEGASYVTYEHFKQAQMSMREEMSLVENPLNRIIPEERFDSIIGAQEAKDDLKMLVSFLHDPEHYTRLGAKPPHGILLEGFPGTGKTLLARAVAGEADCSFFKINGSELVKGIIGEGAECVKELFKEARKHAPSIIFIDEIDAIAARNQNVASSLDATLNQLLVEMDGFGQNKKPVIVIAATNRPEVLDEALLRPGRFDRKIIVPLPTMTIRLEMLTFFCSKIALGNSVNVANIAKSTIGYSGAELANLVNQAALLATHEECDTVELKHFTQARELMTFGTVNSAIKMSDHEKRVTAFHEAGHALVYLFSDATAFTLDKVTIIPRLRALGVTTAQLQEEKYSYTQAELFAKIQVCLGGRLGEEIEFGIIGTGANNDFEQATITAHTMVREYGMSNTLGVVNYGDLRLYSQKTSELIDIEVKKIIDDAYNKTRTLLLQNHDKLTKLALALLEYETLDAEEIYKLLKIQPKKKN